jgi:hypothetical protein
VKPTPDQRQVSVRFPTAIREPSCPSPISVTGHELSFGEAFLRLQIPIIRSFVDALLTAIKGPERGVVLLTVSVWEGIK